MSKSMSLSPKHGLNPSMNQYAWCGEVKEIVLFGKMKGDKEAPKYVVTDYVPCDECRKIWDKGVALLEVTTKDNGNPVIRKDKDQPLYPTMRQVVITKDAAKRLNLPDASPILLEDEAFEKLFGEYCTKENDKNG